MVKQKQVLRAYDLDDTILRSVYKQHNLKKYYYTYNKKINFNKINIILTARHQIDSDLTWKSVVGILKNVNCIIFNPKEQWDKEYIAKWKVSEMKKFGITEYVDDNKEFNKLIRKYSRGKIKCLTTEEI
jgi:hypothetical protein